MSKQWNRVILLAIPVLLALVFSAFTVTPALADDSVPPPADPAVTDAPPVDTSTGTDVVAADDPAPAEEPAVVEEPVLTDEPVVLEEPAPTEEPVVAEEPVLTEEPAVVEEPAPADEPAAEDAPVAETAADVLAQLPEGTEVVVTDATGEVVPLATTEAAEAIVSGDPMWCPTGVTPGGAGCTGAQTSFANLLPLIVGKSVAGTIWIEDDYVGTSLLEGASVTLDGVALGSTANFALTLQGGWTGTGAGINSSTPSIFNVPLVITNWLANVTLNDILVTAVPGGASTALTVTTTKNITLKNVKVRDNVGSGANLNNSGGTGTVSVTSSEFINNANGSGLNVNSKGTITLNSVTANNNGYDGVFLNNSGAATAMAVTITNSIFNDNAQTGDGGFSQMGLQVFSKGAITLTNIDANYNGGNGDGDFDDGGVYLDNTAGTAGVTMTGVNFISDNEWGLGIFTNGAVLLSNMVNNGNANGSGAFIDNCGWTDLGGGVWGCTSAIVAPVTILGTNQFKLNGRGLHITTNGAITLNNVTATFNQGTGSDAGGAYLWNANSATSAGVTLTGLNTFSNNNMTGLQVYTKGLVTLNNLIASNNGWYDSVGDEYYGYGAYIDNTYAATPKAVSILGNNSFIGNANGGLVVFSKGAIIASNIFSVSNGWVDPLDIDPNNSVRGITDGAYLDNCALNDNGTPGNYDDDFCTTPVTSSITLTGTNSFNGNSWGNGVHASSLGAISVSNLTANDNGGYGASLDNNWYYKLLGVYKLPYSGVTVSGYGRASNNGDRGIGVFSTGIVTMSNLTADNNRNYGVQIFNAADPVYLKAVTILGANSFNNNSDNGLHINSYGAVLLYSPNANNNGGNGVFINNCGFDDLGGGNWGCTASVASPVTILGTSYFNNNYYNGLEVHSKGAVLTSGITARNNGHYEAVPDQYFGNGVFIDNSEATIAKTVTIGGLSNTFNDNKLSGIEVYSKGAITVNKLTANWNGWVDATNEDYWDDDLDPLTPDVPYTDSVYGYGAKLVNTAGLAPVTVTGVNYFDSNWNSGLHVESKSAITVYSLTSNWNGQENGLYNNESTATDGDDANGAYLDNWFNGANGNVTIVGYANTEGNTEYGLEIYSKGIVSLTNVTANNNWFEGAHIENSTSAAAPKAVTILGTNQFNNNNSLGLVIKSYGAITLNNINANWNGGPNNAYIDNCISNLAGTACTAITQSPVTLTGANSFDGNWGGGHGLYLTSFGNIVISKLSANNNNGHGAYIDNQWINEAATPVYSAGVIMINGYADLNGNGAHGLDAWSYGNVTIVNLNANNNGGGLVDGAPVGGAYINAFKNGTGFANVVLTGYNNLNQNSTGQGLTVYADGAITISNLSANENWDMSGAILDNTNGSTTVPMPVTLTGYNSFWHNFHDGLRIYSNGAVTLSNVDANDNGVANDWSTPAGPEYGWGVYIDNINSSGAPYARPVTLTGTNNFQGNWNSGLEIRSTGMVTLYNINAGWNGNYYDEFYSYPGPNGTYVGCGNQTINTGDSDFYVGCGVYVNNSLAFSPLGVTFVGPSYFERNAHDGLTVISNGLISLTSVTSNGNGTWYDMVDTTPDTVSGNGAFLYSNQKGVILSGVNSFNNNWTDGLVVIALDAITISNLEASNNRDNGAYFDNDWGTKHQNVTISGYASVSNNGGDGLTIYTNGSVSLVKVSAINNGGSGAIIDASDKIFSPTNVTISGTNYFEGNRGGDGLNITAFGVISLNNINANWNSGRGAFLDNIEEYPTGWWAPIPPVRLSLTGVNTFNGNGGNGLEFLTYGNVNMTKVTADRNDGNGVLGSTIDGNITLACGSMNANGGSGYSLTTSGKITLSGVNGYSNFNPSSATGSTVINNRLCPLP